jgi:hypothetical protein
MPRMPSMVLMSDSCHSSYGSPFDERQPLFLSTCFQFLGQVKRNDGKLYVDIIPSRLGIGTNLMRRLDQLFCLGFVEIW